MLVLGFAVAGPLTAPGAAAAAPVPAAAPDLVPLSPARVVDTRYGTGAPKRPVPAGSTTRIQLAGRGGVPASGVAAVVLNLTAVGASGDGFLTLWPSGGQRPTASNLNYRAGQTIANRVYLTVGSDGSADLYSQRPVDVVIDVTAYLPTGSSYQPLAPQRVLDTRGAQRPASGSVTRVKVAGKAGVPASGAGAVALTVTAVNSASRGYATVFPTGAVRPTASTLNYPASATIAALTVSRLGPWGEVDIYVQSSVDVVVDVAGWYPATASYTPMTPLRVADSRFGTGISFGTVEAGRSVDVPLTGVGGIPTAGLTAVEINITATQQKGAGFITAYPAGQARPTASTLNVTRGVDVANSATLRVGAGGAVTVYTSTDTQIIVDVVGYFTDTPVDHAARQVGSGWGHTCAVTQSGGVRCWGRNSSGSLGYGDGQPATVPVPVTGLRDVVQLAVGGYHNCALLAGGTVKCWGEGVEGQLGDGRRTSSQEPVTVVGLGDDTVALTAGTDQTCALSAGGAVSCWGRNTVGQLGTGTTTDAATAQPVHGLGGAAVDISAGALDACAVLASGAVQCWGYNGVGQLGDGTTQNSALATTVMGVSGATRVAAGGGQTCAVLRTGAVRCWGVHLLAQDGSRTWRPEDGPYDVIAAGASEVTSGGYHGCARMTAGSIRCWGVNAVGSLGDGTTSTTEVPVPTLLGGGAQISAGGSHTCAVLTTGSVRCWGWAAEGQLGDGISRSFSPVPVAVSGL